MFQRGDIYFISMVSRKLSACSFVKLNDSNITSKELLANSSMKTNPANIYLFTQNQKTYTRSKMFKIDNKDTKTMSIDIVLVMFLMLI